MKRTYRVVEILVMSTWTLTFFLDWKPELIRALSVVLGMTVTIPRLYSGMVKRESPINYPLLDDVVKSYPVINLKASPRDLNCLSYPGLEAVGDEASPVLVLDALDYDSEGLGGKHVLLIDGKLPGVPTIYLGTEAYKIATTALKTSIPCILTYPDSTRQVPLNIG